MRSTSQLFSSFINYQKEAVLYFHWPYCLNICSYCNFNKYAAKEASLETDMINCLVQEAKTLLKLSFVHNVKSIYFGGGTPSLVSPSSIKEVVARVSELVNITETAQISLECNPSSPGMLRRLPELKSAGVNRVSVGLQGLDDHSLKQLGRDHSASDGISLFNEAWRTFGGGSVSLDVLFGRPGQNVAGFEEELGDILALKPNHVSLYQLTPERGTPLYKQLSKGELELPCDEDKAKMYESAVTSLENAGLERYEVSNFAKEGSQSLHNLCYWNGTQYIGVGPGAHGRFFLTESGERESRVQIPDPKLWMKQVLAEGHGTKLRNRQNRGEILAELLATSLRTKMGIQRSRWETLSGEDNLFDIFGNHGKLEKYLAADLLVWEVDGNLRVTERGLNVVDSILPDLINVLNDSLNYNN